MYERLALYDIVTDVGNAKRLTPPYALYAKKGDSWKAYIKLPDSRCSIRKRNAARFFIRSLDWCEVFYKDCYGGKEKAYEQTERKEELIQQYIEWFAEKRRKMRKEMEASIRQEIESITKKDGTCANVYKNVRGNQGGVANLLKVLTRTMERQGADIRSIAKVQYSICRQAGIMIPEEFIEDVAVVLYAEATQEKKK